MPSRATLPSRPAARAAAAAALLAVTGCGSGSGSGSGPGPAGPAGQGPAATAVSIAPDEGVSDQDARWAAAMAEHHLYGVQLVGLAAEHAQDPAVLQLAGDVQTVDEAQIQALLGLLKAWGKPAPEVRGHEALGPSIPGVLTAPELERVRALPPAEFDRTFLGLVGAHQSEATRLAQQEVDSGRNGEARRTAAAMVQESQQRITRVKELGARLR